MLGATSLTWLATTAPVLPSMTSWLSKLSIHGQLLTVDQVLNETGQVDPFVVTSALVKLPAGYHEVSLTWFQNAGALST
eukprot:767876-Hanusia_phi.AAC.13